MEPWSDEEIRELRVNTWASIADFQPVTITPQVAADHIEALQNAVEKLRKDISPDLTYTLWRLSVNFWPPEEPDEPITKIGQEW